MDNTTEKNNVFWTKRRIKTVVITIVGLLMIAAMMCFNVFLATTSIYTARSFDVPVLDVVDDLGGTRQEIAKGDSYYAHPDLVEADDGTLWVMYPVGHGRGAVQTKKSTDFGATWTDYTQNTPVSWQDSQETPTLYNLHFVDDNGMETGESTLVLISGNPAWSYEPRTEGNGFNYSTSTDNGETWSEFVTLYGEEWAEATGKTKFDCIVAMASLTQLKENGKFVNKWMGLFHDHEFFNYKSILTFETASDGSLLKDADGRYIANWSEPTPVWPEHRDAEKLYNFCEVEVIREPSADGTALTGDRLVAIARCNAKKSKSYMLISSDEGATWDTPKELPKELCGDRHKAEYDPKTKRFVISFRQLCVFHVAKAYSKHATCTSIGWVGWVGSFEQLVNGSAGDAVIVLGATSNTDNGYSGTFYRDGQFLMIGYGYFDKDHPTAYIMSAKFSIDKIAKKS